MQSVLDRTTQGESLEDALFGEGQGGRRGCGQKQEGSGGEGLGPWQAADCAGPWGALGRSWASALHALGSEPLAALYRDCCDLDLLYCPSGAERAERKVGRPLQTSGPPMTWLRLEVEAGETVLGSLGCLMEVEDHPLHRQEVGRGLCQGGSLQEGLLQGLPF